MSKSIPEIKVGDEVYLVKDREAHERLDELETFETNANSGLLGTKQLVFNQDGTVTWVNG